MHAILVLDWWWKANNGEVIEEETDDVLDRDWGSCINDNDNHPHEHIQNPFLRRPRSSPTATHAPAKLRSDIKPPLHAQPHTYHPLLNPYFSPLTQTTLLTILDILLITILAGHTVTYFLGLPTALAFCDLPEITTPLKQTASEPRLLRSRRERCIGLNVDIHVAGGFAVFMAVVLGLLHLAALGMRLWACGVWGRAGVVDACASNRGKEEDGARSGDREVATSVQASLRSHSMAHRRSGLQSSGQLHDASSLGHEEHSTGVRFVDWSAERAGQRGEETSRADMSKSRPAWSEALLECLIP